MDELLLVRMLDEDVGTKELGLDPSPPFFFLSRLRTWQSRTQEQGGPAKSCSQTRPRLGYLMAGNERKVA